MSTIDINDLSEGMQRRIFTLQAISPASIPKQSDAEVDAFWANYFKAGQGDFEFDPNNDYQKIFSVSLAFGTLFKLVPAKELAKIVYNELPRLVQDAIKSLNQTGGSVDIKKRTGELISDTVKKVALRYIPKGAVLLIVNYLVPPLVEIIIDQVI